MTSDKPEKPDLPETPAEAEAALTGEDYFIPIDELPDDPDALQDHIQELYIRLASTEAARKYSGELLEWTKRQTVGQSGTKERSNALSDRSGEAMDRVGYDSDDTE
jgi:hypothetical protein